MNLQVLHLFFFFSRLFHSDGVRPCPRVLQVPRGFRLLQPEDLLAAARWLPQGGWRTEGEVRQCCCHEAQLAWEDGADAQQVQCSHESWPGVHRIQSRLLPEEPKHGLAGHSGAPLQQDLGGHGWVWADVLRARLRPVQGPDSGALPLQVPLVLLRQVQALHQNRRPIRLQVRRGVSPVCVCLQTMGIHLCVFMSWGAKELNTERMEERNYINYIYRVKQLCHCKKTDSFFQKKKKNLMSSETESIVKYLFWDCYDFILAQSSPADFYPVKCLNLSGNPPPHSYSPSFF